MFNKGVHYTKVKANACSLFKRHNDKFIQTTIIII